MKKSIRISLVAIFALVNLALVAAPADAFGWKTSICDGEDGELVYCCTTCLFLCSGCILDNDDGGGGDGGDGGAN